MKVSATKDVDDVVRLVYSTINDTPLIDAIVKKVYETITQKDMKSETKETAQITSSSESLLTDSVEIITPRLSLRSRKRQPVKESTRDDFFETSTSRRGRLNFSKVKIVIPSAKLSYPSFDVNKLSSTTSDENTIITTPTQRRREVTKEAKVVSADENNTITTSTQKRKKTTKKAKAVSADGTIPQRYVFKCSYTSFDKRLSPGRQWTARFQFGKSRYIGGFATREAALQALEIVRKKLDESTAHTCHSVDEAIRFARDLQSSRDEVNRYLGKKAKKLKSSEEGSASTSSFSQPSNTNKTGSNSSSTSSSNNTRGMEDETNSDHSSRHPPNNNNNDSNGMNETNIPTNTKWTPCENPWGDNGYCDEDFLVLSSTSHTHNTRQKSSLNDKIFPTNCLDNTIESSFCCKAFVLTRDRENTFPWGFTFDNNSNTVESVTGVSNDACTITSITPCSPAEAAVSICHNYIIAFMKNSYIFFNIFS